MMRLQRVGRKNDPTFRIVVVDKRTGPKSNKNIDILGSYNPKMNHVQVDKEKASEWLSKGVQPSDTVHNILVGQKVIEASKKNVLPKKSPIVDEEALAREAEEKAKQEAEATASTDASEKTSEGEASSEDTAADATPEESASEEETQAGETLAVEEKESVDEASTEEVTREAPAEETEQKEEEESSDEGSDEDGSEEVDEEKKA